MDIIAQFGMKQDQNNLQKLNEMNGTLELALTGNSQSNGGGGSGARSNGDGSGGVGSGGGGERGGERGGSSSSSSSSSSTRRVTHTTKKTTKKEPLELIQRLQNQGDEYTRKIETEKRMIANLK